VLAENFVDVLGILNKNSRAEYRSLWDAEQQHWVSRIGLAFPEQTV